MKKILLLPLIFIFWFLQPTKRTVVEFVPLQLAQSDTTITIYYTPDYSTIENDSVWTFDAMPIDSSDYRVIKQEVKKDLRSSKSRIEHGIYRVSDSWSLIGSAHAQESNWFGVDDLNLGNTVFLLDVRGQSNATGRATAQMIVQLSQYLEMPQDVKIFFKEDYTTTDNGSWDNYTEGGFQCEEPPAGGPESYCSFYGMLATLIKRVSPNPVYILNEGDGGTALALDQTDPDWNEDEIDECFDIYSNRYYSVAYAKIEAEQPGKTIIPISFWLQGEGDAQNGTSTSNYSTNFGGAGRFVDSWRASHASLANNLMIIVKLNFLQTANETTINQVFQDYADAHAATTKVIDVSDQPREQELTDPAQTGGITPESGDEHLSYLSHQAIAERAFTLISNQYFPGYPNGENLTNTGFDPTTISGMNVRLQFSRSKVTAATHSILTAVTNDGAVGTFSTFTNSPRFKVDGKKGRAVALLTPSDARIQSSAAIGTTLFQNATGFSINFFIRPRDGQPPAATAVFHDIASTGSPNNSRLYFLVLTTGKVHFVFAQGGTAKTFQTTNVIFLNSNLSPKEKHIAITMNNSTKICKIYVDGVEEALDNSDFTGTDTGSYTNGTNVFTLFAARTGAGTYGSPYTGHLREFQVHTGTIYTAQNVLDLGFNSVPIWIFFFLIPSKKRRESLQTYFKQAA